MRKMLAMIAVFALVAFAIMPLAAMGSPPTDRQNIQTNYIEQNDADTSNAVYAVDTDARTTNTRVREALSIDYVTASGKRTTPPTRLNSGRADSQNQQMSADYKYTFTGHRPGYALKV